MRGDALFSDPPQGDAKLNIWEPNYILSVSSKQWQRLCTKASWELGRDRFVWNWSATHFGKPETWSGHEQVQLRLCYPPTLPHVSLYHHETFVGLQHPMANLQAALANIATMFYSLKAVHVVFFQAFRFHQAIRSWNVFLLVVRNLQCHMLHGRANTNHTCIQSLLLWLERDTKHVHTTSSLHYLIHVTSRNEFWSTWNAHNHHVRKDNRFDFRGTIFWIIVNTCF